MHIVQVYHAKVPVRLYGGMERVIEALISGFVLLGHKVTLIAYRGDYDIPGAHLIDLDRYATKDEAVAKFQELIPDDADLVHYHVPFDFPELGVPNVLTLHGNLGDDEDPAKLPNNTIFISKKHATNHDREFFIHHGLDSAEIPVGNRLLEKRDYFSFLGRASLKRKGLHLAKKITKSLDGKLRVGGGRGISWGRVKYLGHLDNQQKYSMLSESKAFLFPILWEEPFGLVMIEALFCGTPVWGLSNGSVPEVLGQEGSEFCIVANSVEEMIEKGANYKYQATPSEIRAYAEKYFSHIKMCESYIAYFRSL